MLKQFFKKGSQFASFGFLMTVAITALLSLKLSFASEKYAEKIGIEEKVVAFEPAPTTTPTARVNKSNNALESAKNKEVWGVAKQIDESTWTIKVAQDKKMGMPQEIFEALNAYRQKKGVGMLSWDDKLASFAQKRAETFASNGSLDNHAGFNDYFKEEQGLKDMGFWGVGENSSFGFQMEAVHLIEWVFASDPPHDNNQLDPAWTHVGIGVSGTAADLIFAKSKM